MRKFIAFFILLFLGVPVLKLQADDTTQEMNNANQGTEAAVTAVTDFFVQRYSDANGIHLESVISALGATAGFGTQIAIREAFIKTGKISEKAAFVVITTKDGNRYYFGDLLNEGLLGDVPKKQISVWGLIAGGAQAAGATSLPDIQEIARHNAAVLGSAEFGVPRLPEGHVLKELPLEVLRQTWPSVRSILEKNQPDPRFWGWIPALAIQKILIHRKDSIDPFLAATIAMEAAIPMSKLDPETVISPASIP